MLTEIIPNQIIQIFLGEEEDIEDYPNFQANKVFWQDYCKQYDLKYIWITKDNIGLYLGEYSNFYYNLRYTWNRIDFARYIVLNKEGGIYVDLDICPNFDTDINDLLIKQIILNKWYDPKKKRFELNNALMGIRPGFFFELIKYSVDEYLKRVNNITYKCWKIRFMMHTTGTRMFKRWCLKNKLDYTDEIHHYVTDHQHCSWIKNFH